MDMSDISGVPKEWNEGEVFETTKKVAGDIGKSVATVDLHKGRFCVVRLPVCSVFYLWGNTANLIMWLVWYI